MLRDEIARGGMGVIFRATDAAFGREVAVKVLQEGFGPASAGARRFADEARITGQLQHPGIPPVHDLGVLPDGRPFLAMKLIKGDTLDDLLTRRPDPDSDRGRFIAAFEKVCEAVGYAHAHGVIHRDLKPSNVMVGAFGEVQVMDWGLAKVMASRDRQGTAPASDDPDATTPGTVVVCMRDEGDQFTQAGSVLGTPAYMPPEQAVGAVGKVDPRSDVFGLGAILAVILTGKPPFEARSAETTRLKAAQWDVTDCFERLGACGADPELVALCKRCLSLRQDDRPADAGEVAQAVADLRAAADERARQAELDRVQAEAETTAANLRVAEQRKRARLRLALAAAVALLLLGGGAFAWYQDRQRGDREREQAATQAAARTDARQKLESSLGLADTALKEDELPAALVALDRAAELLDTADDPALRERYDHLWLDVTLVAELDRVWTRASTVLHEYAPGAARRIGGAPRFDEDAARKGYPVAFTARGLAITTDDAGSLADRIGKSPARDRLIAALDDWLPVAAPEDRPRLCDLLARTDPDDARNAVRKAHLDPATLAAALTDPPPGALRVAARAAMSAPLLEPQVRAVLRAAAARHPDDFPIQYAAGVRADTTESAVAYLRAAVALRPDNAAAVYQLGFLLYPTRPDEGADYLLRAIELDPGLASAYITLADAIKNGANPDRAVAHFKQEIARDPNRPMPHFGLGMALRDSKPREAAEAFTRAIARDDGFAPAHHYLGYVARDDDTRIRCYRRAIELDPTFAFPHFNLAGALRRKGDLRGAEAEYREALKHFPQHTFSYMGLAELLAQQNRTDEAAECWLAAIRTNAYFSPAYPPLGSYLLQSGKTAEAVVVYRECVARFPTESLGYDGLIIALARQGDHAAAVGVYVTVALRGLPNWPADVQQRLRYNAACSAVLAGIGLGRDAPPETERGMYRHQALSWLRAELAGWRKLAGSDNAAERKKAADALAYWLRDANLSMTRPGPAQTQLPAAERAEWDALWADVKAALAEARQSSTPLEVAPPPREVMR